jgi:ribokinase
MGEMEVVVLGGAAVDWVARVEALPRKDSTVLARSCEKFPGGSAANVAVGVARLGHRVGFVGKLGDDENGQLLLQAFEDEGIDTQVLIMERGRTTATCFIAVNDHGDRIIFALPGASLVETVTELDLTYVGEGQVLYIGPAYVEVATAAAKQAREKGATVFYAPSCAWGAEKLASIRPILESADVLLVSHIEATALTGQMPPTETARLLSETGPSVVIETLGQHGVLVRVDGRAIQIPAFTVTGARDTTGAGDAFAAGLVAGFLEGLDWEASARLGSAVAALKIQHIGARSGLPTREEVGSFMDRFQGERT